MKPYGNQLNLKKKVSYESKKNSEKISLINIKFIHQIFDTINISLMVLIFTLFFLSFNSQRKWSNTYKNFLKQKLSIIISLIIFLKLRNFILVNLSLSIFIEKLNLKIKSISTKFQKEKKVCLRKI